MNILVHDYAGHPFQVELSRALARRGHTVRHVYSASNVTPQGALQKQPSDPESFDCVGIRLPEQIDKSSLVKRRAQERQHGRLVVEQMERFRPEAIISANTPLDAQALLQKQCRTQRIRSIYWVQDLLGIGTDRVLRKKLPGVGHVIGAYYKALERALLRASDTIVLISEDFTPSVQGMGIDAGRMRVIENWAPLDEMPVKPRRNAWAQSQGLDQATCFLYSGTLGMKHNPDLLLQLALKYKERDSIYVIVISEGPGAEWLKEKKAQHQLERLRVLPYQPFEALPDVLASAEVLMAILEPEAGIFSVPSKVLTYLCAGRPLLLAVPPENLAAKIVAKNKAGLVVPPTDTEAFVKAADCLLHTEEMRAELGHNARRYAETHFDIAAITDKFEAML